MQLKHCSQCLWGHNDGFWEFYCFILLIYINNFFHIQYRGADEQKVAWYLEHMDPANMRNLRVLVISMLFLYKLMILCCMSIWYYVRSSLTIFQILMQIAVHLWATGGGTLSSHSFLIIQDVASVFSSNCFDTRFVKTYKAFIGHCQFLDSVLYKHMQFLRNSLVELCSLDVQKSSRKAMVAIKQLAKTLQLGLQMKQKVCNEHALLQCLFFWIRIYLLFASG